MSKCLAVIMDFFLCIEPAYRKISYRLYKGHDEIFKTHLNINFYDGFSTCKFSTSTHVVYARVWKSHILNEIRLSQGIYIYTPKKDKAMYLVISLHINLLQSDIRDTKTNKFTAPFKKKISEPFDRL